MGVSPAWVRKAIRTGATVSQRVVKLEAEAIKVNGRCLYRIHEDAFVTFLRAIGSKRLPATSSPPSLPIVPRLLDVAHVAQVLRCCNESVRRLLRQKELTGSRRGRRWQVDPRDLQAFIDAKRVTRQSL